jgi:biotin carboxylase
MNDAAVNSAKPVMVMVGGSGEILLGEDVAVQAFVQARARGMATCQTNQAGPLANTLLVRAQCDESWVVDYEDPAACAAWAAERVASGGRIDVVLGTREFAQVATAEVAAAVGAPGNPPDAVRTVRNKDLGRAALAAAGFPQPTVRLCESIEQAREFLETTAGPWVVKPRDAQGSEGVCKVEAPGGLEDAVGALAPGKPFIVEEFVVGREFSVEGVFLGGRPVVLAVTEKQLMPAPLFVEAGHVLPARLPEALRDDCVSTVEAALTALRLRYGVFHTELWSTESGIVLGEVHVRNGGDWIHRMIQHAVPGLDLFGVVFDDALGTPVDRGGLVATRGAAVRFFLPPPGVIRSVAGFDEVVAHPAVLHARLSVGAGSRVGPVRHSHDRVGEVVVGCDTPDEAEALARKLVDAVTFEMAEE